MTRSWQWGLIASALGLLLVIVGAVGPWVPHKTSALAVTGIELVEFAKFFPRVQSGAIPVIRALFALPILAGAVVLAILAHWNAQRTLWRIVLMGLALGIELATVPPYQFLRAPEYRLQLSSYLADPVGSGRSQPHPRCNRSSDYADRRSLTGVAVLPAPPTSGRALRFPGGTWMGHSCVLSWFSPVVWQQPAVRDSPGAGTALLKNKRFREEEVSVSICSASEGFG